MVWAELPPVPMPSTIRPGASSSRVRMALAVTEACRECGTVTPGPSLIRFVPRTQAVRVTQSSRQTRCVSVIHTVSKPSASASWTCLTISGTGCVARIPRSNFTPES
jgi:hypothetical protein